MMKRYIWIMLAGVFYFIVWVYGKVAFWQKWEKDDEQVEKRLP